MYDENLCLEPDPADPEGLRLAFQTTFTPAPPGAEQITFRHFSGCEAPMVFYRAGSASGKSVCLMLCDRWFERKVTDPEYVWHEDWGLAFRAGPREELPEAREESRWKNRVIHGRPLSELDFCMSLRSVHETLAHGRVLSAYERYAMDFPRLWREADPAPRG